MKKIVLILILITYNLCIVSQSLDSTTKVKFFKIQEILNEQSASIHTLNENIKFHKVKNFNQQVAIDLLKDDIESFEYLVDSLKDLIITNSNNITINSTELDSNI